MASIRELLAGVHLAPKAERLDGGWDSSRCACWAKMAVSDRRPSLLKEGPEIIAGVVCGLFAD